MAFNIIGNMKLSGADSMIHEIGRVKHATEKMQRSVKGVGKTFPADMSKAGGAAKLTADQWTNAGTSITNASRNIATAAGVMTAALVGVVAGTVNVAKSYESAFAEVKKVVDETADISYDDLMKSARDMSKEIPASFEEIADAMANAGRLGVPTENLEQFAKAAINMGVATNLSSEDAAQSMARFANIMDMPLDQVDKLGSAIVHLGNNFATSESEIMTMAQRLATAGKMSNMSESDVLALSAAMSNVGIAAERGGTAMSTTMYKITSAMKSGGEEAKGFAKVAGMSVDEFADAWENDAAGALNTFLAGLSDINDEGGNVEEILGNLGINAQRQKETISALALSHEDLARALSMSSEGFDEGTALAIEAGKRYETFDSKLQVFKNTIRDVAYLIGSVFAERLSALMDRLQPVIAKITDFTEKLVENNPKLADSIANFTLWAIAIGAVVTALATLGTIFGFVVTGIGQFKKLGEILKIFTAIKGSKFIVWIGGLLAKLGKVTGISKLLAGLKSGLAALSGPVGWIILGIAAVIGVLTYLYKTNDKVKEKLDEAWSSIKETAINAFETVATFIREQSDKIVVFWQENSDTLKEAWANLWEFFGIVYETIIVPLFEFIKRNLGGVQEYFLLVWDNVKLAFETAWNLISNHLEFVLDLILGLVEIFGNLLAGDIGGTLTAVWDLFKRYLKYIWDQIKTVFTFIWEFIGNRLDRVSKIVSHVFTFILDYIVTRLTSAWEFVKKVWSWIKGVFSDSVNNIKKKVSDGFASIKTTITTKVSEYHTAVKDGFAKIISGVVTWMLRVKINIKKGWNDAIKYMRGINLWSIGRDIVNGLINGIKSKVSGIGSALMSGINTGVDKFKSFLGINSPSKLFEGFGINIDEGLVKGIDKGSKGVVSKVAGVSNSITSAFNPNTTMQGVNLAGEMRKATNKAQSSLSASVQADMNQNRQPAEITLVFGDRTYRTFVEDLTKEQQWILE